MNKLLIVHAEKLKIVAEIIGRNKRICEEWAQKEYQTLDLDSPYAQWWTDDAEKFYQPAVLTKSEDCHIVDLCHAVGIEKIIDTNHEDIQK